MDVLEKQIKITAKLYDIRRDVREICGADFFPQMAKFGEMIQRIADHEDKPILAVMKERAQLALDAGDRLAMGKIIAAAVELIEPSKDRP